MMEERFRAIGEICMMREELGCRQGDSGDEEGIWDNMGDLSDRGEGWDINREIQIVEGRYGIKEI